MKLNIKFMLLLLASLTSSAAFAHAGHEHPSSALLSGLLHFLLGINGALLGLALLLTLYAYKVWAGRSLQR